MTDGMDDIRKQVQDRVDQEAAQLPQSDDAPEITSKLIADCLFENERGDGILFATQFRDRFVYCKNSKQWFRWNGNYWEQDIMDTALVAVETIALHYLDEYKRIAGQIADLVAADPESNKGYIQKLKGRQEMLLTRAKNLRGGKRRNACVEWAHTIENPLAVSGDEFDNRPMLFPCKNGVIDLETGKLRKGNPGDYLSLASPVEFRGIDEPAPLWEKSLLEIFNGNEDTVSYIRRLFGYCMTGLIQEKLFPIFYGKTGWNGRSVIVETISDIMGKMAGAIPSEMLLSSKFSKNSSGPSADLMDLKGRRLATASEIDENQKFSAAKIKWLTGRDEIVARRPNDKEMTHFKPVHKLILMTNTLPQAPPNDRSFWERVHLINFRLSFVKRDPRDDLERKADLNLDEKLKTEASGILAWLLRGCLEWQRKGLSPTKEIIEERNKYWRDEDLLMDFVEERCVTEPALRGKASDLYGAFVDWYHDNHGQKEPSGTWFGKQLAHKFEKSKSVGCVVYHGVDLKSKQGELT